MDIAVFCGFGILAAVLCMIVGQIKPDSAAGIRLAAGIVLLGAIAAMLAPSVETLKNLTGTAGMDAGYIGIMLKALAVCYITTLSADCARDAGENSIASKLELGGRAAVAALAMPVFASLAEIVTKLVNDG